MTPTSNASRRESYFLGAALVVAALLLYWRCLKGIGTWGDEEYNLSTAWRYLLGDRPLIDSWDTNFSSSILAMPFLKAYWLLKGSLEGVFLAFRMVFFVLSLATSLLAWRVMKESIGPRFAAGMAILLILYLPYLSPMVGYAVDWLWHMMAALMAYGLYRHPPRFRIMHALPGIFCALGIIGNPPTITVVPFFLFALYLAHRKENGSNRGSISGFLGGGLLTGIVFLLALRWLTGAHPFALLHELVQPDDHDYSLKGHLSRLIMSRWVWGPPLGVGVAVELLRRRLHWRDSRARALALALALLAGLAALATHRISVLPAPQSLIFIAGATLLTAQILTRGDRPTPGQYLLVLPAFGAGLGWYLGSNGGVSTGVQAAPLLVAAGLTSRASRGAVTGILLVVLIGSVGILGLMYTPEGETRTMSVRVGKGPFKGIYGTSEEVKRYDAMVGAFEGLPPAHGRIVFMERYPLGYLLGKERPGTYSTWATYSASARLGQYVSLTGNRPTRIVLTRFAADLRDGEFPPFVNLDGFEREYSLIYQDPHLRVYDKR